MKHLQSVLFALFILGTYSAAAQDSPFAGVATNANVELLPIEGMHKVTQPDGSIMYLSTNRRFAFVGTMYDLWQGEALTLGVESSSQINLERNGVSLEKIAFPLGDSLAPETLFIAPECQDCVDLLALALDLGRTDLNIVMLASTAQGHNANGIVWCAKDRPNALRNVYLEHRQMTASDLNADCDKFGLMLAEQASLLFGIGQLPLLLDSEGNGHIGQEAILAVSNLRTDQ